MIEMLAHSVYNISNCIQIKLQLTQFPTTSQFNWNAMLKHSIKLVFRHQHAYQHHNRSKKRGGGNGGEHILCSMCPRNYKVKIVFISRLYGSKFEEWHRTTTKSYDTSRYGTSFVKTMPLRIMQPFSAFIYVKRKSPFVLISCNYKTMTAILFWKKKVWNDQVPSLNEPKETTKKNFSIYGVTRKMCHNHQISQIMRFLTVRYHFFKALFMWEKPSTCYKFVWKTWNFLFKNHKNGWFATKAI